MNLAITVLTGPRDAFRWWCGADVTGAEWACRVVMAVVLGASGLLMLPVPPEVARTFKPAASAPATNFGVIVRAREAPVEARRDEA
jgi:hypothetical protein